MRLNPQQAPLYGECVLTVQLDDDDVCRAEEEEEEDEVEFYLLFSGSTQSHVSSTLRVRRVTLQAVCPAHNVCEQVLVTLCWARPSGTVDSHSQETFCFVQDLALDMAHFLLDSTGPQEALLLDDEQIPLRECERLDESLALALKHLSMPHHRTANADVDRQMCHQTHTSKATDTYTQSDTDRNSTEIHKESWMDVSTQLDSCSGGVCLSADSTPTPPSPVSSSPAASQSQQLCSLLHLAAGHGLRTVASFLLSQPGARDSLRRTDARGQTAIGVAESRGHQQLVELFTEYTSGIQVEPKEELHLYPERRVFQHHANLDTYTLTSTGCGQREGGSETGSIQEEVEELRRLIRIHRHSKGESHTATPVSPASGRQLCSNRQPGTRQDAGLAVVTTGEQGSPPSLEERTQGAEPAYVTQTSCTRGQLCQSQEAGKGLRATPAANCPAGQNRKSKKRTTKTARRATESAGNRNTSEAGRETARGSTKTLGSGPEKEETVSAAPSVRGDRGVTETQHSPGAEETPLPRKPLSALGGDGTSVGRKAVALPTTTVVEKQEEEEKEVDVLIYEQATETERENPPEGRDQVTSPLGPAAHRTVTMGQEQSQEHQETQSDPEEPSQPDSTNKSPQSGSRTSLRSPDVERKPRRLLWRDGGWIGSTMGPPPCGLETVAKTVWYQGENLDQGVSKDSQKHEVNSQSVWYDSDVVDERKREQLEQAECGLSSTRAPGLSPPQLSEQGLSSRQQCAALTQPHTAGARPAPSHGSAAQRREVHGSQRGEEVEPDCKEGGEEGDHTETSYSRESCEPADIEETPGGEERGAKSRKKRRKKRGRRGEAKLSSSSSIESQSQGETQALREPVTNLSPQSETEPEAQDLTGGGLVQSPTVSEPAQDQDAMHPPSQTKSQSRDTHGPDCDITASDSSYTGPTDHGRKGLTEATESSEDQNPDPDSAMASDLSETDFREDLQRAMPPGGEETLEPSELDSQTAAIPVHHAEETKDLSAAGGAVASVDPTGLLESRCLKELPVRHSDPTALTEDLSLVEFPEHNTQHVQSVDSQPGLDSVALPCEGPPLQTREGRIEPMEREHFEQRLSSEMLRDQEHERQKGGDEEGWGEETSVERTGEEKDSQMLRGEDWSFTFQRKKVEDEDFPSSHRETERSLVATAVAVVAVAIASAVVSVELRQHAAGRRSDSQQSADGPLLAQNANITQLMECVHSSGHSTHTETRHLSADTEDQLRPLPEGPANTDIPEESHPIPVTAAQLYHTDEANLHTPRLPKLQTDEVQPATTQNKLGDHMKPVPHKTITAGGDSRAHMQTETQLSCPGVDTGRDPESPNRLCPESESKCNPQDQYQARQTQDRGGSLPVESAAAEGEGEGRGHEQDSPGEGCHPGVTDRSDSPCEGKGPTVTLPVGPCDWAPVAGPCPEPTVPLSVEIVESQSSQSLVDMKLITAMFHGKGPESVAEDDEDEDPEPVDTVDGWKQREKDKREREEEARRQEVTEEDTSHTLTCRSVHSFRGSRTTVTKEAEPFQQESEGIRRDSNSTQPVQIQREGDVFYPVQPCPQPRPQPSTGTSYAATEECVSVCVSHRDTDSLTIIAELDDSVFKKPDPPPSAGLRGRGVCLSCSSDHALMQAAPSTSEGAWSGATPDTVVPQSSRLSWKSETEDRGGGGEEEEKDRLPENPVSSAILRGSIRSLSPFRRHSWEPGRNNAAADLDVTQRSSLKSLPAEVKRAKPPLHRRSMSWCPSNLHRPDQQPIDNRSYSLEGLEVQQEGVQTQCPGLRDQEERSEGRCFRLDSQERGSLVSLTEEEQEGDGSSIDSQTSHQVLSMTTSCPAMFHHQTLTKSISMVTISHRDEDVGRSFSSNSGSLEYSISEEEPGPLRSDTEGKGGAKISRTFSYLRSKMSKKGKEKEKERRGEKERESKEREKKNLNNHVFIPISPSPSTSCQHCTRPLHKDSLFCNNCGVHVHKSCKESVSVCTKSKAKLQQQLGPEAAPGSAVNMRSKSTSSASSLSSTSSSSSRERWSTVTIPDDQLTVLFPGRRHPSFFTPHSNLAKSISTSNIAGLDDVPLRGLKFLSQSTDSLHQGSKVNASTESLTDEGTEMIDSQLMGEFECDMKDLEADSWSSTVDKKFLKTLKKDEIKRQDVIYELYQTEFHHVRTLKIMSEVYYKGLQREVQLETDTLDKIFPVLDDLLLTHTEFLTRLLETKRASSAPGHSSSSFLICRIGDILVQQFSDCSAERMKKVYGKFCSRHSEAVNLYKDLQAKDKRFQAFIKRTMSSSIVRRLSIPECILLVTQRITKYPVLIQRILQHTKDSDGDHSGVCESLRCVKDLIAAVDSKVNEQEKKRRLREVHSRTDSKSIMRMKSGQMFAKEDLIRGRKLLHDGVVQLKNSAGRLKDVRAMLLSDVLVFLQEKDQKYVFASLDQRSTVISLQNLIVREVANEERGLFLITAGTERPEMVEVLASSKEERNTWRAIIQDAMHCMEKDEDEGVPSETEEDRRQQENRAKEIRELLRRKDEQIVCLLEEKVHIFRELGDCNPASEDTNTPVRERMLFRATPGEVTKGEPIIHDALREVESLHTLVCSGVGAAGCSAAAGLTGGNVGPVCLPRRAETFGGFDSHQMNSSKSKKDGDKEEGEESLDLRRTESDSVLKKGATASLQMLLKRNNEQVQLSVIHLHDLLISLQAVVVQQDSFVEDQRQALNDRLTANSSRHSSSSSLSSSSSSRPSSLIEQEKHRSLERQRQEAASLQKQQAAHQEEKRRREKEWDLKEKSLAVQEERLRDEEEETRRRHRVLLEERETLQRKKEEYHRELERLREAQRRLERDQEALRRDSERLESMRTYQQEQLQRSQRTPSTTSEDSIRLHGLGPLDLDPKEAADEPKEVELSSSAPTKEPFLRIGSKRMGKNFNLFSSSSSSSSSTKPQGAEKESQLPSRLRQLAKPKEKKKKKGKGGEHTHMENKVMSDSQNDGDIFFC